MVSGHDEIQSAPFSTAGCLIDNERGSAASGHSKGRRLFEYCRLPMDCSVLSFEVDHIVAEKHGGQTTEANLALACCYCNRFKGPNLSGVDPATGATVRLFHPRRDKWADHFFWKDTKLVGRTPVGRVTIRVLEINALGHLRV